MIGIGVNILGQLTRVRYPAALRAYWQRVRDDGGVMLSMNAATDAYRSAPDASLVWAASAYDTGTLYSVLPVGGTGDFTVARNSPAYTDNADGTLSEVAVNVPKFVYRNGKFYALPERAATNLLLNSLTLSTQDVTVTAQAYTLQFRGTGSVALSGAHTATLSGTGVNDRVTLTFTPSAGTLTLTITGSVTYAQLETGSYASSYILTEATTETRDPDLITKTGAADLIGETEGTMVMEINISKIDLTIEPGIFKIGDSSNQIAARILTNNLIRFIISAPISSGTVNISTENGVVVGINKFAYSYKSGKVAVSINGGDVTTVTGTFAFDAALDFIQIGRGSSLDSYLNDGVFFILIEKTQVDDAKLKELSTL
jgi:hypothetical protein